MTLHSRYEPRPPRLTAHAHSGPFDIAIIGGGATGLGAAVDAASRGHSVVLVEQSDFAKGTSSRSTKLVHGGVRYLKQGNVSLVLEALRERGLLVQKCAAPRAQPAFVIPSYHWWEGPFYGIGLKVYDALAGSSGWSLRAISRGTKSSSNCPRWRPKVSMAAWSITTGSSMMHVSPFTSPARR
jgi:glycerol-3-phosphate dehydrogenase